MDCVDAIIAVVVILWGRVYESMGSSESVIYRCKVCE